MNVLRRTTAMCSPWAAVGRRLAPALLILVCTALPARAQRPDDAGGTATPFVTAGHWALDAARRLEAAGLVRAGFDAARRTVTLRELDALFARAVLRAEARRPQLAGLARAYRTRFLEEFPGVVGRRPVRNRRRRSRLHSLGAAVEAEYARSEGQVRAGLGYKNAPDWTGARPVPDAAATVSRLRWATALGPYGAGVVAPSFRSGDWALDEGYVTGVWRGIGGWVGRRAVGFGPGFGGGIVLSDRTTFDGGGVFLDAPLVLGPLGPVRAEGFMARLERNGSFEHPWFWGMRGSFAPHPRVTLGLSRGVMFGGEGNSEFSLTTLAAMLIGKHSGRAGEYDNQVVALDVRYRPPLGPLPVALYLEWGMDDSAAAWRDVPAVVAGLELAAVPGLPQVGLGIEHVRFEPSCCGNPIWYRNWAFRGGWTDAGRLLGHPLGGHGTEWRGVIRADLLDARLRLRLDAFVRERGEENVFAPDRAGRSRGGAVDAALRLSRAFELYGRGTLDAGEAGWEAYTASGGLRLIF